MLETYKIEAPLRSYSFLLTLAYAHIAHITFINTQHKIIMSSQLSPYILVSGTQLWSMYLLDDTALDMPLVEYTRSALGGEHLGWMLTPCHELAIFVRDHRTGLIIMEIWAVREQVRTSIVEMCAEFGAGESSRATTLHMTRREWELLVEMREADYNYGASDSTPIGLGSCNRDCLLEDTDVGRKHSTRSLGGDSVASDKLPEQNESQQHTLVSERARLDGSAQERGISSRKGKEREVVDVAHEKENDEDEDIGDENSDGVEDMNMEEDEDYEMEEVEDEQADGNEEGTQKQHPPAASTSKEKGKGREIVLGDSTVAANVGLGPISEESSDGESIASLSEKENDPRANAAGPSSAGPSNVTRITGTTTNPSGVIKCDVCGLRIAGGHSSLKRHKKEAHDDKVWVCNIETCAQSRAFTRKHGRRIHRCNGELSQWQLSEYAERYPVPAEQIKKNMRRARAAAKKRAANRGL
jgi:hypothetical protein